MCGTGVQSGFGGLETLLEVGNLILEMLLVAGDEHE